jgi:hypothetical protein
MTGELQMIRDRWVSAWPMALAVWSRFVQLSAPHWCFDVVDEKREQLSGSFAMIRLMDHAVVISLRQVQERHIAQFAVEILAHEIGHHVYCPADLTDNARLLARIRAGLPTKEHLAAMVANLYTDLLINDRLQRSAGLSMDGVYRALNVPSQDRMWTLYMRIYEYLWSLPRATIAGGAIDDRIEFDARLGARLIRSYARDWLDGSGRFACLCLPYLIEDEGNRLQQIAGAWHDTRNSGAGGCPDGLVQIDADEAGGAIHPAEDPELSGLAADATSSNSASGDSGKATAQTGIKSIKNSREPFEYAQVLRAAGVTLPDDRIIARYYRELATPYLVKFPARENAKASDPCLEGLDTWEIGMPVEDMDWLGTLMASPLVVPGVTTRQRIYGPDTGTTPDTTPVDLYLGIDCSGSMGNPASRLSYPVLAGAIIALSALRTGSRVMVALSGEPGRTITTDGFIYDEAVVLNTLTNYLGTGMTFGIHRLADVFTQRPATARAVHILIITDNDIFQLLDTTNKEGNGWDIAEHALTEARGGGTLVLQLPAYLLKSDTARKNMTPKCARMKQQGWTVANVDSRDQLIEFAGAFSKQAYGGEPRVRVEKP